MEYHDLWDSLEVELERRREEAREWRLDSASLPPDPPSPNETTAQTQAHIRAVLLKKRSVE